MANINGKRVAIIATDGVEQSELTKPRAALDAAGAKTALISPKQGKIKTWQHSNWSDELQVDQALEDARADDFDALFIPGGTVNADRLRLEPRAVELVKAFFVAGKPIAAICHAPWLLVEADVVRGRTLTSWPSLKTDIRNAGGDWVDREVATDMGIVTSRKPDDIPAFSRKMIEEIAEGIHAERSASARARREAAEGEVRL